jgi:peptidoglycan/LPS O-acetylase OafA/YrhL
VDKLGHLLRGMDISYGVYIYHMIVINVLLHLDQFSAWGNFSLTIVVTTVLGLVSWVVVEKPALARKKFTVRALPSTAG